MKTLKTNARLPEVVDTASRLLILFEKESLLKNDTILKAIFEQTKQLSEQLSEAIKSDRYVSDLEQADTRRDEVLKNLSLILKGYTAMPFEEIKQVGIRVNAVFEKYGLSITRENYAVASAHIESLLNDLSEAHIVSNIEKLSGVAETIALLTQAQKDFNEKRVSYQKAIGEQKTKLKSAELKKQLLHNINSTLIPYLTSLKSLKKAEALSFIEGVGKVISDTNIGVLARSKKPTNEKSEKKKEGQ